MPQMNPIWWFSLFTLFILHLTLTNPLNYFFFSPTPFKKTSSFKTVSKNWKW